MGLSPGDAQFGYKYGNIYPCVQQLYQYMPYRTLMGFKHYGWGRGEFSFSRRQIKK